MSSDRRQWLRWALGSMTAGTAPAGMAGKSTLIWRERALLGFGTTLWLRAAHADADQVDRALDAAVALLRHLEQQMSLFIPSSALCQLNRNGHLLHPDPDLLQVLRLARHVAQRSQGAFDVTVQPLWATWQRARAEGRKPTAAELNAARAKVDWRSVITSPTEVRLAQAGMSLTLNGIAQGYAAERTRALMQQHGIHHALLDTGEWAPMGRSPTGEPWRLGLASPRDSGRILATLQSDGRGVAVSSDANLRFGTDPADDRDHHILDPRTGRSPRYLSAVAVIAESLALADALTKVMFMGTARDALRLAGDWGVGVIPVDKDGAVTNA